MKSDLKYRLKSKRVKYVCIVCNYSKYTKTLHQHRINPKGDYSDENVVIVCQGCHNLIHQLIRYAKSCGNITDYHQFITEAKSIINDQKNKAHSQVS